MTVDDGLEVRELEPDEVDLVGDVLGLARLHQGDGFYLVAWLDGVPAGHLHLALTDPPELQDVQVAEAFRRRGVADTLIAHAEDEASRRCFDRIRLGVGLGNDAAQELYRRRGYVDAGLPQIRTVGTIMIRTGPIEVDDTIVMWEKRLGDV